MSAPILRGIKDRSFLAHCAPDLAAFFAYWDERRRGRAMPTRADIDPAELTRHLPDVLLVDVEGEDESGQGLFRYRVVGTREVALRGHDPTGKLVQDGFFGPSLEDVLACYEFVRRECSYLYDPLSYTTPDGYWRDEETIFLPLTKDGETVSQILVYSVKRPLVGQQQP